MHTNGQATPAASPVMKPSFHAIRVHRIDTTGGQFVRMLAPDYKGLFTHFHQKRSHYCIGEGCRIPTHSSDRTWKGYVPAELLLRLGKPVWVPICLEITEYLELDFRDVYERGQLWELYKVDEGRGKHNPVTGRLHQDAPPPNLRAPFDILPCLRALYHRDAIDLRHPSPLPPRVYLPEVEGELPEVLRTPEQAEEGNRETFGEMRARRAREQAASKKSPAQEKKERGY